MKFDFFRLMLVLTLTAGAAACGGDGESEDEDTGSDVTGDAVADAGEDGVEPDSGEDATPDVEEDVDQDIDEEVDVEIDVEVDVDMDVEMDVEMDVDMDADMDADADDDVDPDVTTDVEGDADVEPDVDPDVDPDVEQDVEVDAGEEYECAADNTDLNLVGDDDIDNATPLADEEVLSGFTTEWTDVDFFASPSLLPGRTPYVTVTYEGLGEITGRVVGAEGEELTSRSSANGTLDLYFVPEDGGFGGGNYFFEVSADACLTYSITARYNDVPPED